MYKLAAQNGQEFTIDGFSLIGRNPDVLVAEGAKLLIVEDITKTISKTHAAIAINPQGQLMIEDLESTNGTFLEGAESFETQVLNGDPKVVEVGTRIRLGDVYFAVNQV